ncbi:unnamed protein product [Microthlaspi erraticum]|uniref:Phorbol-ester/DAG-type domain-containing protein n=1 Tax=Microthlaspi erraticum TaxID=1685480 RepID=A0A6D2KFT0_9BRAS|nr:unnamed protein product [Microthlaspi erraticum]
MHHLRLHPRQGHETCNTCERRMGNLFYTCEQCNFHTDLYCAKYPSPGYINNSKSHGHNLTLLRYADWPKDFYCYAKCGKIGDGAPYKCDECDLTFHVDCADHPFKPNRSSEVQHPLEVNHTYHPLHPLKLFKGGQRPDYCDGTCRLCGTEIGDKLFYHCSSCNFTVDMRCVVNPPPRSLLNLKAHDHQLTLLPRLISFTCNACGLRGDRSPYVCIQCDFLVHQDCLGFPRLININRHDHRILRTSLLGLVNSVCGVCHKKVDWTCGGFSCQKCPDFVVHSKCATRNDVWNGEELEGVPEETEDITPYVRIDGNTIQHFSHKEHNLRFDEGGILTEENKWCSACTQPIYPKSFYGCMECDFVLHDKCANLLKKKRHVLHNERLSLVTSEVDDFDCNGCGRSSNGFRYQGEHMNLDVRCGSISEPFDHSGHPQHPLYFISRDGRGICNCCNKRTYKMLKCIEDKCVFVLDFKCATLLQVVKHRVEDHPLTLSYGEKEDHPLTLSYGEKAGKYWCDICEKETNPKTWFYTSKDHQATLHTECVLGDLTSFMPRSTIKYSAYSYELVINISMSRPRCIWCKSRCESSIILKMLNGTLNAYLCSYHCLASSPLGQRRPVYERSIEDRDCRRNERDPSKELFWQVPNRFKHPNVPRDGIGSACGQERIIVFTTNHLEKLDPALIRRGRMDMHIELSHCTFEAFKILAKNYLDLDTHPLFCEIESLLKETKIEPADVAENLMKKNREIDADGSLNDLIKSLERKKKIQKALVDDNKENHGNKIFNPFHMIF